MKIHFIIHESYEGPGEILTWCLRKNHDVSMTKVYEYESLPDNSSNFDFLMIMGGPQSPTTTLEECPHFNAIKEIKLIQDAINNNKLVLGVCLGAQMIGAAYGKAAEKSPKKEIGLFPCQLTSAASNDEIFKHFPPQFESYHWHGDMPGVPDGAEVLATSKGCPSQIIRYQKGVYGLQCHLELNRACLEALVLNNSHELVNTHNEPYIQDAATLMNLLSTQAKELLFQFLDGMEAMNFVNHYKAAQT